MKQEWKRMKYAVGSSLCIIGLFVSIIVILELSVLQIPFAIGAFRFHAIGFPWLTEQVDDSVSVWRMAGYSQQFPNVYFLNYGEVMLISLFLVALGKHIRENNKEINPHSNKIVSRLGIIGAIVSAIILLYYWVRMTVLWNTYIIGNTVYYPATTPPPTIQWLQQFGLPLNIHTVPYSGGLVFHVSTSTVSISQGLGFDAGLYMTAFLFFVSVILWQYFTCNLSEENNLGSEKRREVK